MMIEDGLRQHALEALAYHKRMLEAIEVQRQSERVRDRPEAHDLVIRTERLLREYIQSLEEFLVQYDPDQEAGVKSAVRGAVAMFAGLFERLRDQPVSEMVRRNYTALSHAIVSAELLHTLAMAAGTQNIAYAALEHARRATALLGEMRSLLPGVTLSERSGELEDETATEILQRIHREWRLGEHDAPAR